MMGKISNLRCSRTKQRKRGNETQKTTHENPDLRGKNLCREEYLEGGGGGKARNKRECLVLREVTKQLSWKALRIVVTKKRPKMGRNLSPLLRQELANLDDDEEYLEGGGGGKARNKRECLVLRELKQAALMESPSNCGNKKEAKNGKKSESITAARIGKS
ncbi:hypothetical protein OIU74_026160 [Salix koriyanagi]|uniref:Uncharacterized protein n=1 Tax=Salix koriyanagi TaxID=2511006 RepID=A0A9Q0W2V3_9ROSI|nr:hypothetical protein OIU74_026160 [Salix koriyanagi]